MRPARDSRGPRALFASNRKICGQSRRIFLVIPGTLEAKKKPTIRREVKAEIATVRTSRPTRTEYRRDRGSPSCIAAIDTNATRDTDTSPFARRIPRECKRRGFDIAAGWIWGLVQEHYPKAI